MDQETRIKPTHKLVLAGGLVFLLAVAVFAGWLMGSTRQTMPVLAAAPPPLATSVPAHAPGATAASTAAAAAQPQLAAAAPKKEDKMIFGLLEKSGRYKILLMLLNATGQVALLKSPGNFTVFAPTDDAFAKFPKARLENLTKPENFDNLKSLLGYHLLNGNFLLKNVEGKTATPNALQGEVLNIDATKKTVMVENARITGVDSDPSNGMIYEVDAVLVPPSLNPGKKAPSPARAETEEETEEAAPAPEPKPAPVKEPAAAKEEVKKPVKEEAKEPENKASLPPLISTPEEEQ